MAEEVRINWQTKGPPPHGLLEPLAAKLHPDEPTVTMVIPEQTIVTRQDLSRVLFKPGIQEVPEHLADHWYLKANKAQRYHKPPVVAEPEPSTSDVEGPAEPEVETRTKKHKS